MRFAIAIVLAVLVVAGATIHALWPRKDEPRTDVEALMRVHAEVLEALVDEDFDDFWDLLASEQRATIERNLEWAREHPDEEWGVDAEELRAMDARTFLEVGTRMYAERHPKARRDGIECLRSLRVREVALHGDSAWIGHDEANWAWIRRAPEGESLMFEAGFHYVREDGAWRFFGLSSASALPFKTLGGKLEAFLPKIDWPELEEGIRIVVTIGPEGLAPEGADLLAARLEEWARHDFMSPVLLDLAPRVSWGSVVRATDACVRAGYREIRFAVATTAGPGPGVRVNGVPVTEPFDVGIVDARVVGRVITVGEQYGRPVEVRLVCPDPVATVDLPWVFETTFTNRGADDVRIPRVRDGDPGVRLVLETWDSVALAAGDLEPRIVPEPPPPPLEEGDARTITSPDWRAPGGRMVLGPGAPVAPGAVEWVVLRPGERRTRIDVVPRRPGEWTACAEILDEGGHWIRSDAVRLGVPGSGDEPPAVEPIPVPEGDETGPWREDRDWWRRIESRGRETVELSSADEAGAESALAALGGIARTDPEPVLRLLAALGARRLSEEEGRKLLRALAESDGIDPALREAASRLVHPD